jgi:hypothetical protein
MGQRASPTTRGSFAFGAVSGIVTASISDEAGEQVHKGVAAALRIHTGSMREAGRGREGRRSIGSRLSIPARLFVTGS